MLYMPRPSPPNYPRAFLGKPLEAFVSPSYYLKDLDTYSEMLLGFGCYPPLAALTRLRVCQGQLSLVQA
jgi:hypothetical protein